jgi:hypothetical protein
MHESENNWLGWVIIIGLIWGGFYLFSDNSNTESDAQFEPPYSSSRNYYYEDEYESEPDTFNGYDCTDDCSGHEAGYNWAEENGIYDEYDCDGNSNSFNEGCTSYVEENY